MTGKQLLKALAGLTDEHLDLPVKIDMGSGEPSVEIIRVDVEEGHQVWLEF